MAAALTLATPALAQFGHPLKGTWIGEWGPNKEHVVVELKWDGNAITGTINPGANGIPLKVATFDAPKWMVHFVIDGKVENIGAYARFITGTWTQGSVKGDFKITRT